MQVKLNRRLGQNQQGDTVEYSDSEAMWLIHKGYVSAVEKTQSKRATKNESVPTGKGSDQAPTRRR